MWNQRLKGLEDSIQEIYSNPQIEMNEFDQLIELNIALLNDSHFKVTIKAQ